MLHHTSGVGHCKLGVWDIPRFFEFLLLVGLSKYATLSNSSKIIVFDFKEVKGVVYHILW